MELLQYGKTSLRKGVKRIPILPVWSSIICLLHQNVLTMARHHRSGVVAVTRPLPGT